jgi:ATP-dependent Clp protease protease subunit
MFERPNGLRMDQMMTPQEALQMRRVLFLYGPIIGTPPRADAVSPVYVADCMWELDQRNGDPIYLVIDSPGGAVHTGLMLYDTIKLCKAPVYTIGRTAVSMGAIILAAGTKGHRYVFPNSTIMLHLPSGNIEGDVKQAKIEAIQMEKMKETLVRILCECGVKKSRKQILRDIDREFYLTGEEAVEYGLADAVATPSDLVLHEPYSMGLFKSDVKASFRAKKS